MSNLSKKKLAISYSGNLESDLFNLKSINNSCEPFLTLRKKLNELNYVVAQLNESSRTIDYVIFWDTYTLPEPSLSNVQECTNELIKLYKNRFHLKTYCQTKIKKKERTKYIHKLLNNSIANKKVDNNILILWEGNSVCPENFQKSYHKKFKKILTWDDDLVDNKTYFKYYLPVPENFYVFNNKEFEKRNFLVNISNNKLSNHAFELYSERFKSILFFDKEIPNQFDLYGQGWDNLLDNSLRLKSYKGTIDDKFQILSNYKFAICYENNNSHNGYITEKIFDCLNAGTVPIYWGAPNIENYVDPNCFIDRRRFKTNEDLYIYLKLITKEKYEFMRNAGKNYLKSNKYQIFTSHSFAQTIVDILKK
jgi:hypothetical protein